MTLPPLNRMQERMVDFALDHADCCWFACPGAGKTRAALAVINETMGRTLIVAPKLVCMTTWPQENRKWGYDFSMRFLHGGQKHLRGQEKISLINYEALPWLADQLLERESEQGASYECPWDFVIYDELSKLKTPDARRFKDWVKVLHMFRYRLGLTGTPVGAHLKDLWGEMFVVDEGRSFPLEENETVDDAYKRFLRQHFYYDEYTGQLDPYHDAEERILAAIRPRAISFDINDLDMPPLVHNPITLDLPREVRDYYVELHATSVVGDLDVYAMNAAVRSGKKRQMASGTVIDTRGVRRKLHDAKTERLREIVDELQGRPVMVFFEFLHDYESICQTLGTVPALYGGTNKRDVEKICRDWNAGKTPVLAVHPRSAAYGLNLQMGGNTIVFYVVPWSYEMVNQGIARVWRQGQRNNVMCHYLIVGDTEDERVMERVAQRAETHERVMEALQAAE